MTNAFNGTGVALVTPFKTDKTIDYTALERIVDHVIEGGVEYLVALGTTGESVTLTEDEKKLVVKTIIKKTNGRVPVVLGIGGNDTSAVINKINETNFDGITGLLSVAPYYNKPSQQGLFEHFSEIAIVSPVPVIVYNVPGRTGSNLSADTAIRLAVDHSNIVAVKEASGNITQVMQIIKNKPAHFSVLSGEDALTLPILYLGGKGVISVVANSHPQPFSDMVRAALKYDHKTANDLHYNLLDFIGVLFEEGSPTGVKAALESMGLCTDVVRLPLVSATDILKKKLEKLMKKPF
jgi:4-hydroxy-tetrahydrodipicolinate synthase